MFHLPEEFKQHPFEIITDDTRVNIVSYFYSSQQNKDYPSIISVVLKGEFKGEPFAYTSFFDAATGDYFELRDLLNKDGLKKVNSKRLYCKIMLLNKALVYQIFLVDRLCVVEFKTSLITAHDSNNKFVDNVSCAF